VTAMIASSMRFSGGRYAVASMGRAL